MTGPEHYHIAEKTMTEYELVLEQGGDPGDVLAYATAHFLAAQVAVAAMSQPVVGMPDEPGLDQEEFDDWYAAVNGLPVEARHPVESYPGELDHLRDLLAAVNRAANENKLSEPFNDLLIDHFSDTRIVDAQLKGGASDV